MIKGIYKSICPQVFLNMHIRQIMDMQSHGYSEWRTKDKDSNVKYKIKGDQEEGRGSSGPWFLSRPSFPPSPLMSENPLTSQLPLLPYCLILSKNFFLLFEDVKEIFKSLLLQSISTLWLGYCSCSCCWCQWEAMPRYLAPHWSLSPPCHHRVMLRLEEDDNGCSKQFATADSQCHLPWLNYFSSFFLLSITKSYNSRLCTTSILVVLDDDALTRLPVVAAWF